MLNELQCPDLEVLRDQSSLLSFTRFIVGLCLLIKYLIPSQSTRSTRLSHNSQYCRQKTNGIVSSKIYDKRDDFNFEIVNFSFLDGDVPRSPSYGVYISQLIRFARVCSNVDDFNNRNLFLTAKLLKQVYRYHKIRKAFSKFYHRHSELIVKYSIGLNLFCNKAYQNLYFMVTLFINLNELLENLILVINSKKL